ncbi:MAG: protein-(glutamine-N5) methyltransferase, release factor-specific, partial [Longicatena sp.]
MSTYREVLKKAQAQMEEADRGEQAAFLYLLELTNKEAHNLYMEYDEEMREEDIKTFEDGIQRLVKGEPLGHVLGFEWFYG